jgi:hypothetical protein
VTYRPADIRDAWDTATPPGRRGGVAGPAGAPISPRNLPAPAPVAAIPPYWLEKPRVGVDAYFRATGALAAVAGAAIEFGAGQFVLPATNWGVVSFVTIFVDAPALNINVTWALLVNGAPVPGWDQLGTFPRVAANLSIVYPGTVHLPLGARVTVRVTNNAATGPWTVGAETSGWHWPKISEDQAFGYQYG